jgi:hypothetical protein
MSEHDAEAPLERAKFTLTRLALAIICATPKRLAPAGGKPKSEAPNP